MASNRSEEWLKTTACLSVRGEGGRQWRQYLSLFFFSPPPCGRPPRHSLKLHNTCRRLNFPMQP